MTKKYAKRRLPVADRYINSNDAGKLLLRGSLGTLMLFHGVHKLQYGYGFVESMLLKARLPGYLSHGILLGELVAPLPIVFGLYTRPAALIQAFVMVMAIYLVHSHELFSVTEQGGYGLELQALYLFGFLAIFFSGAGRFKVSKSDSCWN